MDFTFADIIYNSPEAVGGGRLPSRSVFYSFDSEMEAKTGGKGKWFLSLNGTWDFLYAKKPNEILDDYNDDSDSSKWDKIDVPSCWDMRGYDYPEYLGGRKSWNAKVPVPPEENPTAVYRRIFMLPANWKKRRTILHFDGVESCFIAIVNGRVVGFSKDSRGASEFDISSHVKSGKNRISVIVFKWSDGSFLEEQDHWWHAGLNRSVYLQSTPIYHIEDVKITATLDSEYRNGLLKLELIASTKEYKGWKFKTNLYDANGKSMLEKELETPVERNGNIWTPKDLSRMFCSAETVVPEVQPWNTEKPYLYTLTVSLFDPEGKHIESTMQKIGFRTIEITGREMRINGQPVLISGVNMHEHDPFDGRTVSLELTKKDIFLMKQFNINAIRTSHYPHIPEFYDLCDEFGIYVLNEANIENNDFFFDLCSNPKFGPAYVDRIIRMAVRDKNHPCVIIWSLGNESGVGPNHAAAAGWLREYDSSRPLHYQMAIAESPAGAFAPGRNHLMTDFICPMYSKASDIRRWAEISSADERPFLLCEYSHAMGNSNGGLKEYYDVFRNVHGAQGGFIWEWLDHGIARKNGKGWLHGSDFGKHNDHNYVIDGLVDADRTPHAAMFELKKLAQSVNFYAEDLGSGHFRLVNDRFFTNLSDCKLQWEITVNGIPVQNGEMPMPELLSRRNHVYHKDCFYEGPRHEIQIQVPYQRPDQLYSGDEVHLKLSAVQKNDTPWAPAGFEIAWEQFNLPFTGKADGPKKQTLPLKIEKDGNLSVNGKKLFLNPAQINFLRAPLDNDGVKEIPRPSNAWGRWRELKIFDFKETKRLITRKKEKLTIESVWNHSGENLPLRFTQTLEPSENGVRVLNTFDIPKELDDLPRIGVLLELPKEFDRFEWFGRGPQENLIDRNTGYPLGCYRATIDELHVPYTMPQENGQHTDVRYVKISAPNTDFSIRISAPEKMEFSASRYSMQELMTKLHDFELEKSDRIYLKLDYRQRGAGTGACGCDVRKQYQVGFGHFEFIYEITSEEKDCKQTQTE